jgi:erythromycin esterase-like protein
MSTFQPPKSQPTSQLGDLSAPPKPQSPAPSIDVWSRYAKKYSASDAAAMLAKGSPKIIGLGEGTHRAKEMFQAQADITKQLIECHQCKHVMIEADGSDMMTVSSAIRSSPVDGIKAALRGHGFLTVSNHGFLSLCEFLRRHPGVRLSGLDVQTKCAAEVLREESGKLAPSDLLGPSLRQLSHDFKAARALALEFPWEQEPEKVKAFAQFMLEWADLSEDSPQLYAAVKVAVAQLQKKVKEQGLALLEEVGQVSSHPNIDLDKVTSALRSISELCRLYEIGCGGGDPIPHRDQLMAETAARLMKDLGKAELGVVLAHNGHVTCAPPAPPSKETFYTDSGAKALGGYLKDHFPGGYRVLQQIAGGGTLGRLPSDKGRQGINYAYPEPESNDIEFYLAQVSEKLGDGPILFDVEEALKDADLGPHLKQHIFNINSTGLNTPPSSTFRVRLPEIGDVILFYPKIHPEQFL